MFAPDLQVAVSRGDMDDARALVKGHNLVGDNPIGLIQRHGVARARDTIEKLLVAQADQIITPELTQHRRLSAKHALIKRLSHHEAFALVFNLNIVGFVLHGERHICG